MMTSFYNLLKYAATGVASPDMTYYDRMRASTLMGGNTVQTLTGQPPLSFKADGTPLISWSMKGNGSQTGTPTPDNPVMPTLCGVRTGNLFDKNNSALVFEGYNLAKANTFSKGGTGIVLRIPCEALTTYTISGYVDTTLFRVAECNTDTIPDQNPVSVSDMIKTTTPQTYTLTTLADTKYILIQVSATATPEYRNVLMLNLGSAALPYEPYGYKIPISSNSTTTNVYLGEVQTTRKIRKLVLDGTEKLNEGTSNYYIFINISGRGEGIPNSTALSTHTESEVVVNNNGTALFFKKSVFVHSSLADFKTYLQQQYAAGTPVTVWYVLAEPETAIVNEPLCKIGDYADELHSADAGVTIPTAKGQNTLTVETDLQPSEMTITYKG